MSERENFENAYHATITAIRAFQSCANRVGRPNSTGSRSDARSSNQPSNVITQAVGSTDYR